MPPLPPPALREPPETPGAVAATASGVSWDSTAGGGGSLGSSRTGATEDTTASAAGDGIRRSVSAARTSSGPMREVRAKWPCVNARSHNRLITRGTPPEAACTRSMASSVRRT